MPRALLAPDSFKGTLSAKAVSRAMALGFEAEGWEAERCPLADGGEGTADTLLATLGGERITARAADPLGRTIDASWVLLADRVTAVVEVAGASGLALLAPHERDPARATTFGTGQLIAAAAAKADRVLIAVGGSATNDGGRGALEAIAESGGVPSTTLVCLCDVETTWELATRTFGPQKGAGRAELDGLEERLDRFALELPKDPRGVVRGGAAGGLAGGLWAALGAELVSGAAYVCDALRVDARIADADLVVGGEGRLDETTLHGKVLAELAARSARRSTALAAIVGEDASGANVAERLGLCAVLEAGDVEAIQRASSKLARGHLP